MSLGMHDSGEIDQTYQVSVVLLSFGISLIGAYVGISLAEIFRVKVIDIRHGIEERSFLHYYYLFLMALSLGGVAIWSMHFIGMHAVTLHHAQSSRVSIRFNLGMSLASLIAVVLTVFGGLVIASRDRMFCKTKAEIIKLFVNDAQKLSVADIRNISATRMLVLIATRELGTLVAGGITTSAGVCIMHYIGMASMMFDGEIRWNAGIVALSVVIAMVASTAAFWILFRLLSIFPEMEWLRMASAFIMAVAVNGMHYTGMVAAEFVETASSSKEQGASYDGLSIGIVVAFFGVLVAANVVVWLLAHVGFKSSREIIHEKSQRLREAYEVIQKLTMIASTSGAYGHQNMQRVLEQFAKREEKRKQSVERKAGQAMDVLCPCLTTVLVQRGVLPDESNASSIHGGNSISVSMAMVNENSAPRGGGGGIGGSRIGNGALGTGIVSKEAALKALQAQAAGKSQAGGSVSTADPQEPRGVEMV